MELTKDMLNWMDSRQEEHLQLLLALAQIPAPSNQEQLRSAFCKNWLEQHGAEGVYLDDALNVIYPIGVTETNPLVVLPPTAMWSFRTRSRCL